MITMWPSFLKVHISYLFTGLKISQGIMSKQVLPHAFTAHQYAVMTWRVGK